jgi:hypothetical protein
MGKTVVPLRGNRIPVLAAIMLAMLVAFAGHGGISHVSALPATPIRSVTVYENAEVRGSLAEPAAFSRLHIQVQQQDSQIELVGQILPTDQRILVVSGLNNQIITALTPGGVVGRSLAGGYAIPSSEQEALLRLNGVLPQGAQTAVVATLLSESPAGVQLLAEVTASVQTDRIPPILKRLWPWLLLSLVLVGAGLSLFKLRRQQPEWEE